MMTKQEILSKLGILEINKGVTTGTEWFETEGNITTSYSPIDGKEIAKVKNGTLEDYEMIIKKSGLKISDFGTVKKRGKIKFTRNIWVCEKEISTD